MGTNVAGLNSTVQEPLEQDYEGEGNHCTPVIFEPERNLIGRLDSELDAMVKDCMEWERRIIHSATIILLTPKAIKENYHMPTLPYPLLKQEVQMLKQSLLPHGPTNKSGGYQGVPIVDYEVMEIEKNQPKWR